MAPYTFFRTRNRPHDEVRPLKVTYDFFGYAAGSTLFEIGNTKVLCAVTLQHGVPHFLRGKKSGWLTAEYALLPTSTPIRTVREITANKRSGRTIEISRLIGRALRSVVKLSALGEQTVFIDCDVLQADGGTRTACITGAFLALKAAQARWESEGILTDSLFVDDLAAISVGWGSNGPLLDMDFAEDNAINADFNFVVTRNNRVIEIQGSAEKEPLPWDAYENMRSLAIKGSQDLFEFYDQNPYLNFAQSSKEPILSAYQFSSEMLD